MTLFEIQLLNSENKALMELAEKYEPGATHQQLLWHSHLEQV